MFSLVRIARAKQSNILKSYTIWFLLFCLSSCTSMKKIDSVAKRQFINDKELATAHIGIAIYDPSEKKFLYDYQGEKYFVPASNTKVISLYAGMKYLGDSLVGLYYEEGKDSLYIQPAGDPSFLHPDFKTHPVYDFLKNTKKPISINASNWNDNPLGDGWMWNDYSDDYMAERSALPVYGNVINWKQVRDSGSISALANEEAFVYSEPDINWKVNFIYDSSNKNFSVKRDFFENRFVIKQGKEINASIQVPFITNGLQSAIELLHDTLQKEITVSAVKQKYSSLIRSQPSDSLYKNMMYRSDNFFAEQVLLMACERKFKTMNDEKIISDLLQGDLKGFPQPPNWVDGSGLSRYNLFSPRDFIWILDKIDSEFGMARIKTVFPTGGVGTLRNLKADSGIVYAKTGSMSGVICLSGFIYTKSRKRLIFSILINNHLGSPSSIRKKMYALVDTIRDSY